MLIILNHAKVKAFCFAYCYSGIICWLKLIFIQGRIFSSAFHPMEVKIIKHLIRLVIMYFELC